MVGAPRAAGPRRGARPGWPTCARKRGGGGGGDFAKPGAPVPMLRRWGAAGAGCGAGSAGLYGDGRGEAQVRWFGYWLGKTSAGSLQWFAVVAVAVVVVTNDVDVGVDVLLVLVGVGVVLVLVGVDVVVDDYNDNNDNKL